MMRGGSNTRGLSFKAVVLRTLEERDLTGGLVLGPWFHQATQSENDWLGFGQPLFGLCLEHVRVDWVCGSGLGVETAALSSKASRAWQVMCISEEDGEHEEGK